MKFYERRKKIDGETLVGNPIVVQYSVTEVTEKKSVLQTQRVHLFPFRTQKLSSAVVKILYGRLYGKIAQCWHSRGVEKSTPTIEKTEKTTTNHYALCILHFAFIWGCSSAGRAPALQAGGHGFESHHLHHWDCLSPSNRVDLSGHNIGRDSNRDGSE